jgi:hypothetical protein
MIAALYVDPRGPYPAMADVDCWDETRDARLYAGPWPVVAHPPCGPWGSLKHLYKGSEHGLAPIAVEQVRAHGGVLEHPAHSRLWAHCSLPKPGDPHDANGGYAIAINQVDWGHACVKPTWLYLVGVPMFKILPPFPGRKPTHGIWYGSFERSGHVGVRLLGASKEIRRRTPLLFAQWLVSLARSVRA